MLFAAFTGALPVVPLLPVVFDVPHPANSATRLSAATPVMIVFFKLLPPQAAYKSTAILVFGLWIVNK